MCAGPLESPDCRPGFTTTTRSHLLREDMEPAGRSVRTITVSFADGEQHRQFEAKAWVYDSGQVMWEARRFVIAFDSRKRKDLKVCRILRENGSVFEMACRALGLEDDEARKDSLRAAAARDDDMSDVAEDPLVRQEYSWNTRFTFGAFLIWAVHSKTKNDRLAARNMLAGLLRGTCGLHAVRSAAVRAHLRASAEVCPDNQRHELCPDQSTIFEIATASNSDDWDICAGVMVGLFSSRDACLACMGGAAPLGLGLGAACHQLPRRLPASQAQQDHTDGWADRQETTALRRGLQGGAIHRGPAGPDPLVERCGQELARFPEGLVSRLAPRGVS